LWRLDSVCLKHKTCYIKTCYIKLTAKSNTNKTYILNYRIQIARLLLTRLIARLHDYASDHHFKLNKIDITFLFSTNEKWSSMRVSSMRQMSASKNGQPGCDKWVCNNGQPGKDKWESKIGQPVETTYIIHN